MAILQHKIWVNIETMARGYNTSKWIVLIEIHVSGPQQDIFEESFRWINLCELVLDRENHKIFCSTMSIFGFHFVRRMPHVLNYSRLLIAYARLCWDTFHTIPKHNDVAHHMVRTPVVWSVSSWFRPSSAAILSYALSSSFFIIPDSSGAGCLGLAGMATLVLLLELLVGKCNCNAKKCSVSSWKKSLSSKHSL